MNKHITSANDNPTWFIDRFTLYQNANSDPESIKRNFLIRIAEFELIVADLRSKKKGDPAQHELILGRRGSGKSTLLRRIQIEIDEQPDLSEKYVAINLAEEQNSIYRLSDLWFEVLEELAIRFKKDLTLRAFDSFDDNQAYTRYLYEHIHELLQESGKRAVLLLDNLDRILENFDDDAHLLRESLLNYQDIQIIGGSTRMNEHFWQYDKPFYDFFRRHRLEGLSFEEIHQLLNHWSVEMELPNLHNYALQHRGRIEAIRILTDGLPRALQYFIQLLLHDSDLYGFDYLKKVMDKATPLYQERLNSLTPPQRKIVQELAFIWEAAPTKILVEKCRMESKLIASFLRQLDQFGIVETLTTGKKNHLYRLSERFFNTWLIVTQGNGNPDQKRQAKYLTLFLESWYDDQELRDLTRKHLVDLQGNKISFDKAMVLSKGLSQSKFISTRDRDTLIDFTLALKPDGISDCELPRKFSEINKEAETLYNLGEYGKALEKLAEIENEEDGVKFYLQALCFYKLKKNKEVEKSCLLAIEKGNVYALNGLANLYAEQGKEKEAEKFYLQAIEKGLVDALYNLANLYAEQGKKKEAETFYLQAIEKGDVEGLCNLANLYAGQGKEKEAENYYLQAIKEGVVIGMNNLANLYAKQGREKEAENYYLQAIEKDDVDALNNLANLYAKQGREKEAETFYLQAIEKGQEGTIFNLALLYDKQGKQKEAEIYYLKEVEKGDSKSLFNLALLYTAQGKQKEAEIYYLKAIEKGELHALNNLARLYYDLNIHPRQALEYMIQYAEKAQNGSYLGNLLIVEIWNGRFEKVSEKIERIIRNAKEDELDEFILNLLYLSQIQLVLSLFESEQYGKMLRERYELIYYATLLLAGRTEDNLLLRIPSEVLPTVEDIVEKVQEKQAFYSKKH